MKKYLQISFLYAIGAMVGGVFFREFTKFNNYTDVTTLGKVHVHLFLLGMVIYMLIALFSTKLALQEHKTFRIFNIIYNIGVPLTAIMMVIRGIMQVLQVELSSGASAAISGIAGIGHIMIGIGIVLLMVSLLNAAKKIDTK